MLANCQIKRSIISKYDHQIAPSCTNVYFVSVWGRGILEVINLINGSHKASANSVVSYVNGTFEHECKTDSRLKDLLLFDLKNLFHDLTFVSV